MRVGYARVSTDTQSGAIQVARLEAAGCSRVYCDEAVSGTTPARRRRQLAKCLADLRPGDVLVVCSLDRLARSLSHLIYTVDELRARCIGLQSLSESIDTATPQGTLMLHLMGALAQFERALIVERTSAGRADARRRGVVFGRPRRLSAAQVEHLARLVAEGESTANIAAILGVSTSTAFRAARQLRAASPLPQSAAE